MAQLEGNELRFRGELPQKIPFERIREVTVEGTVLVVKADEEVRFELAEGQAERWLELIKHPKSLLDKLDVKPDSRVAVVDVHDLGFLAALREGAASVEEGRVPQGASIVFYGVESLEALRKLSVLRTRLAESGALWVVRPKGKHAVTEAAVFEAVHGAGLVDTKVVAFSKTHTAHKCVIPVELRGQSRRRPPIVTIPPTAAHDDGNSVAKGPASKRKP